MTQIAAIASALLRGEVLSIMTGFRDFSCSNLPREISRNIEQKFGVEVSREKVDFTSKYGQPGYYYRYRMNRTKYNEKGRELMIVYVKEQLSSLPPAKTERQAKELRRQQAALKF